MYGYEIQWNFITQVKLPCFFTKLDIVHIEDVDILIKYTY